MSPKNIAKLTEKKHRIETGLFIVEGDKNITELLSSTLTIKTLLVTKPFFQSIETAITQYCKMQHIDIEVQVTDEKTLIRSGTLLTNNAGIAVVQQKNETTLEKILTRAETTIVVVLDDVRDPGNMGTIIRTADWYGVTNLIASLETVDFYNAKTISASMGSFIRMNVLYIDLSIILTHAKERLIPVIVADLQGTSTHSGKLPKNGFLLMGSESHGVSMHSQENATHKVMIPKFGQAESLNVSVATGILLDTIRRGF